MNKFERRFMKRVYLVLGADEVHFLDEIVVEAKKEIFTSIEEHFKELVKAWDIPQNELEKYKDAYLDAYKCLKHNILEEDVFKLKKWFGKNGFEAS